jgi:uncharacterized protein YecE (DUF72 family)
MIHLGTSGYSFRDWTGVFYPPGIPQGQMLDAYARRFQAVEINSTYYRIPHPRVLAAMERKTGPEFRFTAKLHGDITHRRTRDAEAFAAHETMIGPLVASGKFAGWLAQFPSSFRNTDDGRDYVRSLKQALGGRPVFVEFRHDSWAVEETFGFLEAAGLGFCSVDEPRLPGLFPPTARRTGPAAYVRLHGRNARTWWGADKDRRYDYLYSDAELQDWAEKIRALDAESRDTFVFFNNCRRGSAPRNALRMQEILGIPRPPPEGSLFP